VGGKEKNQAFSKKKKNEKRCGSSSPAGGKKSLQEKRRSWKLERKGLGNALKKKWESERKGGTDQHRKRIPRTLKIKIAFAGEETLQGKKLQNRGG